MNALLPAAIRQEVESLTVRFGAPVARSVAIGTAAFWQHHTSNRKSEVCMVVRRRNGHLLTARKTFYPEGAHRLMTGGVEPGERIIDALMREIDEETGLEVAVRRFLAVVAYHPEDAVASNDRVTRFVSFAFLVDEIAGTLGATDPNERLAAYREIMPAELPTLADDLDQLPDVHDEDLGENWREWGRFRAIIHHVVWDALNADG
ncbi:MAG: NUDIX hydrolase [Thermomicrobiales bacterium]